MNKVKIKLYEDGGVAAVVLPGAPTNNVGGGAFDGIGIGPRGEPGYNNKKKKKLVVLSRSKKVVK